MDREALLKHALANAVLHQGKADGNAVLGRALSEFPELKKDVQGLRKEIGKIVDEVNGLSLSEQEKQLAAFGGVENNKKEQEGLVQLKNAVMGKVVTRFAPAPTGPLHILHAFRAIFISYLYAQKYKGKFLLRLEDTDPRLVQKEFYEMIRKDVKSLGISWDKEYLQSDYMELYYSTALELLKKGVLYVCFCSADNFQKLKVRKKDCPCRGKPSEDHLFAWEKMIKGSYKEGEAVVRMKTSMQDPNPAMRDPALLRVVDAVHPLKGAVYKVWPLYNFANVVMDDYCGVTHAFRGKEHEHNSSIQERIYTALGKTPPTTVNFGMMYLPGEKMHKRDIIQGIQEGRFSGWDDLRLHTIQSFSRRGFVPETLKEFSLLCGLSKNDIRIDLGNLEAINRKFVDLRANRYMVVLDPVEIDITGVLSVNPVKSVKAKNHPEREDTRELLVTQNIFVSREDFEKFIGKNVRLLDFCNIRLDKRASFSKKQTFDMKTPKIQWVSENNVPITVLYPGKETKGFGEEALWKVKPGEIIQMIRIGFGRVEKPGVIVFGHK